MEITILSNFTEKQQNIYLNFPAQFFFQANGAGGVKKGQLLLGHNRGRMEKSNSSGGGCMSEPEFFESNQQGRPSKARSEQRIVINGCSYGNQVLSPTSDDVDIFDSHCFATTPSSSNENR